jgi:hypothetical protein
MIAACFATEPLESSMTPLGLLDQAFNCIALVSRVLLANRLENGLQRFDEALGLAQMILQDAF